MLVRTLKENAKVLFIYILCNLAAWLMMKVFFASSAWVVVLGTVFGGLSLFLIITLFVIYYFMCKEDIGLIGSLGTDEGWDRYSQSVQAGNGKVDNNHSSGVGRLPPPSP